MTKLTIAFIAHTKNPALFMNDPSFIYRCENLALALQELGHKTDLLHYTQVDPKVQYDIMVFHRPKYRFGFRHWLKKLRKRGTLVIADFDDLVFDPQWAEVSPGVINQQVSLQQTQKNFRRNQKALRAFNWVTASTTPIVERIQSMGAEHAMLLPNAAHTRWLATPIPTKPERPRLTYFPGTRSHDRDFAIAQPALERYLHDHPEVQLQITGPLSQSLRCRDDQLVRFDKQPFDTYQHHIAQSWLNLAPLQDTLFNAHKSALKAIEGSFFNAATLASPIPDMQRLNNCGAVLVPHTTTAKDAEDAWYSAIAANLPASAHDCATAGLRDQLQQQHHINLYTQQWLSWVEQGLR